MKNPPGTFWPSERQKLLLVAALAERTAALEAWETVRPHISIDELEMGSFPLLPLIYRTLSEAGKDDIDLQRLKGIYRRTWVRNNLLVQRTKATSEALADSGVRAEFVEGVAIASRFYDELALRPTAWLDVLVDAHDEASALTALAPARWREQPDTASEYGARFVFDGEGNFCVVRTRLAPDQNRPGAWLWEPGDRYVLGDVEISVPPPTETLFAVCALHARVEGEPNIQWIVDAKMVMRADVDWDRLPALTEDAGQVLRLRDALGYLTRLPGPTPPDDIGDRLARMPVSRRQRLSYFCTRGSIRPAGHLPDLVAEHLTATTGTSSFRTLLAFPGFLRNRWQLSRTWHLPFAAGKRAVRLLLHRGGAG